MFHFVNVLVAVFGPSVKGPARKPRRTVPQLEALEERWCPAVNDWEWNGPLGMGSANWSYSGDWLLGGAPAPDGKYPGKVATDSDYVSFDNLSTGPATLDVAINPSSPWSFRTGLTRSRSITR